MKRIFLALLIASWLVLLSSISLCDMQKGIRLEADGKPIDVRIGHLVPCVTDWNDDGKKDMIVGQFDGGKIRLYLNHGTDSKPEFGDFKYLHAGGKQISLPAG